MSERTAHADRAYGALLGLAIGDALGMPTQLLPRDAVVARYGPVLEDFAPAPADHPIAAGMPAGSVTDDTEQALLLGRLLVDGAGRVDPAELARRLVAWEDAMRARGSLDLLGPSTKRAVADLLAGADPDQTGRTGDTNGAAMRIAPVGIATPLKTAVAGGAPSPGDGALSALVDAVVAASRLTHHTSVALAGAAAVAAAVSAGVDGADLTAAIGVAVAAAEEGARRGHWVAAADVGARIRWATELVAGRTDAEACDVVYRLVGTSLATQESVPAAFALLVLHPDDPWTTCRLAASVGGDCDTVAAIAGAVAGACTGARAFPEHAVRTVESVNALDLAALADDLLTLRGNA